SVGDKGFLLRIQSQTGNDFTGAVEIMDAAGSAAHRVRGTFTRNGVRFADGAGLSFTGSAGTNAMQGTMTLNGVSQPWSVSR
ncbi:MAG: hypothetical protein KC656_11215, partial [Myxococcales bacterium]|nr:hypothetical protein [Myxococcales bacterium]